MALTHITALVLLLGSTALVGPALAQQDMPLISGQPEPAYPPSSSQQYSEKQYSDQQYPPTPNQQYEADQSNGQNSQDMNCRRQASQESGYSGLKGASASSDSQQVYSEDYYACLEQANGAPPNQYAYGPPPPPPPPYYYGPYPYAYPYDPPYYGPGVTLGFGFGGWHHRWR